LDLLSFYRKTFRWRAAHRTQGRCESPCGALEVKGSSPMRSEGDLERELDDRAFALQRDLLMWRLARIHGLAQEERRTRCLESPSRLRDLLTELEAFLTDGQEGADQRYKNGADCVR
jgi:hypothetical protein